MTKIAAILALTTLLASCGSSVPLTETRTPAEQLPIVGARLAAPVLTAGAFNCDMGNRVDIEADANNDVRLTWKGTKYAMTPVSTTTGAVRFENQSSGLVWIQIPAKSMLLNTRQGAQLANECRVR
ncbi:hypothetical protein C7W93_11160 [Glaciimonas sp. PCH181]|nr:hypothetical protein C7W93_11160 [Glaciimonas sp. PCH181]